MSYHPHGQHLIAGSRVASEPQWHSSPSSGPSHAFSTGTPALVVQACEAAERAFWSFGYSTRAERAALLHAIADAIEARGAEITEIGSQETGLPAARIEGERGRTTGQLRLFAEHILKGDYLDRRFDAALPDRKPAPRPELRMMQRPIGPVAVFGASNFPLAFSVAGGDTAAALAAGCPVVVKGHSAHPGTGEIGAASPAQPAADRRTAETQPVAPVREMRADRAPVAPAVVFEQRAPLETEQDEHRVRVEQPARQVERPASGSRFASMGLVDDELERLDVHEAFLRRVG